MNAVLAGIRGQLPVFIDELRVQIQKYHLLLLRRLLHQIVIHSEVFVGQIVPAPSLSDDTLIQRNQPLNIDHSIGLQRPNLVDGAAIAVVKALIVKISQLVDAKRKVDLAVLFQCQRLQQSILLPIDSQSLLLPQLEDRKAIGGQILARPYTAVYHKPIGTGISHEGRVIKVAVIHRIRLGSGLGKVIARFRLILLLRLVWLLCQIA